MPPLRTRMDVRPRLLGIGHGVRRLHRAEEGGGVTSAQREEYIRAVWEHFGALYGKRVWIRHDEAEIIRRWAVRGIPLRVVLQGLSQVSGKPRYIMACERAVEAEAQRWYTAIGGLTELPEAGPLEPAKRSEEKG